MSYLEEQYLRRVSYKLRNFKQKSPHLWNFSCAICLDSSKKKNKARGYAFDRSGSLIVNCHNCGYGARFTNFLKEIDLLLYQEFIMERFKENTKQEVEVDHNLFKCAPPETKKYVPNIFEGLPTLSDLPNDNEAVVYATSRKLPVDTFEFFYAKDFIAWTKGHSDKFASCKGKDHARLIIPFKARDGHYIGYTARDLSGTQEQKYYRIFIDEDEKEKFFGIDRVDESKTVWVLEGEIDSLMVPNAIAVSNGKLDTYKNKNAVYIPDADRRNPHIVKGISKLFDAGLKVCLFPDSMPFKDLNEMSVSGLTPASILDIIKHNTFTGLSGKLKFNTWKNI